MEQLAGMKRVIEKKVYCVIEETTKYSFSFLASSHKKKAIITEKKYYIEEKLKEIMPNSFPNDECLNKMWKESIEYSNKQFEPLLEKYKLNDFYLQELLHCYAEKIGKIIIESI